MLGWTQRTCWMIHSVLWYFQYTVCDVWFFFVSILCGGSNVWTSRQEIEKNKRRGCRALHTLASVKDVNPEFGAWKVTWMWSRCWDEILRLRTDANANFQLVLCDVSHKRFTFMADFVTHLLGGRRRGSSSLQFTKGLHRKKTTVCTDSFSRCTCTCTSSFGRKCTGRTLATTGSVDIEAARVRK